MRHERLSFNQTKKWHVASVCCHRTPAVTVTEITLSNFEGLLAMAKTAPGDFGYIVVARVIDRSHAARLERKDVDAEALAAFLSLRDASVPPDPAQLAGAALAWAREALCKHLGDADEVTFKVTIFRPKGIETLRTRHVLVRRVLQSTPSTPESVPANAAPNPAAAAPPRFYISANGPTWRAAIRAQEAAGVPVSHLLRGAATVAEQAERAGVPQRPVSQETIEVLRRRPLLGAVPALPACEQPSLLHQHGAELMRAGGASVGRTELVETELQRALYGLAGRGLMGVVQVAVDLSSTAASVASAPTRRTGPTPAIPTQAPPAAISLTSPSPSPSTPRSRRKMKRTSQSSPPPKTAPAANATRSPPLSQDWRRPSGRRGRTSGSGRS